jgi:hypothetical protein
MSGKTLVVLHTRTRILEYWNTGHLREDLSLTVRRLFSISGAQQRGGELRRIQQQQTNEKS